MIDGSMPNAIDADHQVRELRRDLMTLVARLGERDHQILLLERRLRQVRECSEKRCYLCQSCLDAVR